MAKADPIPELEAKYVYLGKAMGHGLRTPRNKNQKPENSLGTINQTAFARAIAQSAPRGLDETITRESMREQVEKGTMLETHQQALSAYCDGFPIEDHHWTGASAKEFSNWWSNRKEQLSLAGKQAQLFLVPGSTEESYICERLATIFITLNQTAPGEPWPITGVIKCFPSPLPIEIAVKRAWLQIDGRGRCTFRPKEQHAEIAGEGGKTIYSWSGRDIRPICDVSTERQYLGKIDLPDEFCAAYGLRPGTVITARLAAFIKDLNPVGSDGEDDGTPDHSRKQGDPFSWSRPKSETMGQSVKNAILARIELLKKETRFRPLPGAPEGWVVLCECVRQISEKADSGSKPV